MRLMLVDDDGSVVETMDDIEEYDLSKPVASASIIHWIQRVCDRGDEEDSSA